MFEVMYDKSVNVMGGVKRIEEKYKEFSKNLKEWGSGGTRNSVHFLLLLIVNYSRDKIRYELSKLILYKERLQSYDLLRFQDVYFEENPKPITRKPLKHSRDLDSIEHHSKGKEHKSKGRQK